MRKPWKKIFFGEPMKLLDQFSEYVDEDRVNRVPYSEWRGLVNICRNAEKSGSAVGFLFDDVGYLLYQIKTENHFNEAVRIPHFHDLDSSFGEFIWRFISNLDSPWAETKPLYLPTQAVSEDYEKYIDKINKVVSSAANTTIYKSKNDSNFTINYNIERENKSMKFNFDFGSCENDNVRISPYGIAIKNADGTWVSYDTKSGNLVDVDIFNFDGGKYLFKMPVAVKDIKVGDIVIHNRVPVYVVSVDKGDITVIDPRAGDKRTILPLTNMFGFNFITKVVSLLDGAFGTANADQPFGNMLPFFLVSNSKGSDIDPLVMAMMFGGNAAGALQNPMMLALLCADQTNMKEVLPLMMLGGQFNLNTPTAKE